MVCRILLLFILTSLVSGSFVVNVTQTSYQAEENHNITLEWKFTVKPNRSVGYLSILCELIKGQDISVLYHVHEGAEVSESQDQRFSGRVQSDKDALREGRIRLQVSRLRTDDSGLYLCEVNTDYGFSLGKCQLNITAVKDCPEPERKPERSHAESRGRIGLYCALTAALLLLCCCLSLTVFPKKMLNVRPPPSHQTDHLIQFDQHVKKAVGPESNEPSSSSSKATKTVPVSTPFSHKADTYLERLKLPT